MDVTWAIWESAGVSLAVGALIGAERERSAHRREAGLRSFALASFGGFLAMLLGPVPLAALLIAVAALMAVGYARTSALRPGATTEIALVITVALGGVAVDRPALAAAGGVATTVLLAAKGRLHAFVRHTVTEVELTDALKFLVVAFIVLPLVPSVHIGPYGAVDPRKVWVLVVAMTGIGWVGYIAVRALGAGRGLPLAALASGFVSGAAATATMARRAKDPALRNPALAGAALASVATLSQLLLVTAVADPRVTIRLLPAALAGVVVLVAEAIWLDRKAFRRTASIKAVEPEIAVEPEKADAPASSDSGAPERENPVGRPFALGPALLIAAILTAVLVVAAWANDKLGSYGAAVACAAAGLADAHSAAAAAASLAANGELSPEQATLAAGAALLTNTVTKLVLAFTAGGAVIGRRITAILAAPVVVVAIGIVLAS